MTERAAFRPTLAVDFDGVIHSYERGWQGGELYGCVTAGFWDWLSRTIDRGFDVVVHSSRFVSPEGMEAARQWFLREWQRAGKPVTIDELCSLADLVTFSATKPPAWLTIDDRCVPFTGDWNAPELQPEAMLAFKPWTQRKAET